jgi:uncharacterized membrane protein YfcA
VQASQPLRNAAIAHVPAVIAVLIWGVRVANRIPNRMLRNVLALLTGACLASAG